MDDRGGGEADDLGAEGGGVLDKRGAGIIFCIHFPSSFLKPILVMVPRHRNQYVSELLLVHLGEFLHHFLGIFLKKPCHKVHSSWFG